MPSRRVLLILIVGLAAVLRLTGLEASSLWYDEIGQVLIARHSWWEAITLSANHAGSAPLDYLITHFALRVGHSDGVLRLPALLFGVGAVVLIYYLGRSLFGTGAGLLAAFALALTPMHIAYSHELRFYSLTVFMGLATALVFWQAHTQSKPAWWVAYGGVLTLGLYSHYYLAFVAAGLGLWCLLYARRQLVPYLAATAVAFLLFAPWVYYDNVTMARRSMSLSSAELLLAGGALKVAFGPFIPLSTSAYDLSIVATPARLVVYAIWALCLVGLLSLPFVALRKQLNLVLLMPIIGIPASLFLDYLGRYPFSGRQTLLFLPFILLAAAGTFAALAQRVRVLRLVPVVAAVLLALGLSSSVLALVSRPATGGGEREIAWFLHRYVGPNDVIVVGYPDHAAYYAPDLRPLMTTPNLSRLDTVMAELTQTHPAIWVLPWMPAWTKNLQQWSQANGAWDVSPFAGREIYLYTTDPAARVEFVTLLLDAPSLPAAQKAAMAATLARFLAKQNQPSDIIALLEPYAAADFATPPLWIELGKAYMTLRSAENFEKARGVFAAVLEESPSDWQANYHMSSIAIRDGAWDMARHYAETAIAHNPSDYGAMAISKNLLTIYDKLGEHDALCALWQDATTQAASSAQFARMVGELADWATTKDCD